MARLQSEVGPKDVLFWGAKILQKIQLRNFPIYIYIYIYWTLWVRKNPAKSRQISVKISPHKLKLLTGELLQGHRDIKFVKIPKTNNGSKTPRSATLAGNDTIPPKIDAVIRNLVWEYWRYAVATFGSETRFGGGELSYLQLELLCLQLSFFAGSPLRHLIDALPTVSRKAPIVSKFLKL